MVGACPTSHSPAPSTVCVRERKQAKKRPGTREGDKERGRVRARESEKQKVQERVRNRKCKRTKMVECIIDSSFYIHYV